MKDESDEMFKLYDDLGKCAMVVKLWNELVNLDELKDNWMSLSSCWMTWMSWLRPLSYIMNWLS